LPRTRFLSLRVAQASAKASRLDMEKSKYDVRQSSTSNDIAKPSVYKARHKKRMDLKKQIQTKKIDRIKFLLYLQDSVKKIQNMSMKNNISPVVTISTNTLDNA